MRVDWTSSLWLHTILQLVAWVITEKQDVPVLLLAECVFFHQRDLGTGQGLALGCLPHRCWGQGTRGFCKAWYLEGPLFG